MVEDTIQNVKEQENYIEEKGKEVRENKRFIGWLAGWPK